VNWFRHYGLGSHISEWLGLALILLALCIALLKRIFRIFTPERDTGEGEEEYWRRHGG
jgi:hypothetical protein